MFSFTNGNAEKYRSMLLRNRDLSIVTTAPSIIVMVCINQTSLIDLATSEPAIRNRSAHSLVQNPGIIISETENGKIVSEPLSSEFQLRFEKVFRNKIDKEFYSKQNSRNTVLRYDRGHMFYSPS